jgi:hypothetical protein
LLVTGYSILIAFIDFYCTLDMLEIVKVQLYYGTGEIRYGPQGIDLSNFNLVEKNVKRALERIWEGINSWLCKVFSVDLEQQCMTLINRSD